MSGMKLSFSLKKTSTKKNSIFTSSSEGFEPQSSHVTTNENDHHLRTSTEPLVIPVQQDGRQSLQEQARLRREMERQSAQQQQQQHEAYSQEDQAAIDALIQHAGASSSGNDSSSKMVIEGTENTFQRVSNSNSKNDRAAQDLKDAQQLHDDLNRLAPEVSVDSAIYRQVPIADFGAAMLRGMGWKGQVDTSDIDKVNQLPRPSRLGLGATPKLLEAPTHGKMRRQDQVQRDEQVKQQQQDFETQRLERLKLDRQRTIQEGSIVWMVDSKRAIIRKWQGVPGLNMCLVQYEGEQHPVKVKKGDLQLIDRDDLHEQPFVEPNYENDDKVAYLGMDKDQGRNHDREDRDAERDRKRQRDEGSRQDHKRHKTNDRQSSRAETTTWLIPHIKVRLISSKIKKQYYKEKGVVEDVTRKGMATLIMGDGQVIQAPESYLETALPKVGGSVCILTGKHRMVKGKLLERDSRKNRGAVQVFEDMSIVTTSLDDMAEWCGPLDDDLIE